MLQISFLSTIIVAINAGYNDHHNFNYHGTQSTTSYTNHHPLTHGKYDDYDSYGDLRNNVENTEYSNQFDEYSNKYGQQAYSEVHRSYGEDIGNENVSSPQ